MKILIVYTSRESGNTKKLAEALAAHFGSECELYDVAEAPAPDRYDFIALGFGVYHNYPDCIMIDYMRKCRNKDVGLFMTLGMWPDSVYAYNCFGRAEGLMPTCRVRVKFACQGAYTPEYLEKLKNRPPTSPHAWTPERAERIMEAMKHPDADDLKTVCEKFEAAVAKLREKPSAPEKSAARTAILCAFFGSTVDPALKAYDEIENAVRKKYPEIPLFRAYTSGMVRRKRGNDVPSAAARLQELFLAGYDTVHILAGYLTPGAEYHKLKKTASVFSQRMNVTVTRPPLSDPTGLRKFLPAVLKAVPAEHGKVLYMGHGNSDGRSAFAYMAAAAELAKLDPAISLACVEGEPGPEAVFAASHSEEVHLIPFMLVAGDHALNDLGGEGPDSWRSQLEKRGCTCYCTLHGLGEIPEVAAFFADSLPGEN
ncbi:MAG: sirohydrochlorin cobaltochelatase [Lentisphaeria bacterium]|nr:sirohydrochlorin cobaltochelatase [Lentisphaeria bacterium]